MGQEAEEAKGMLVKLLGQPRILTATEQLYREPLSSDASAGTCMIQLSSQRLDAMYIMIDEMRVLSQGRFLLALSHLKAGYVYHICTMSLLHQSKTLRSLQGPSNVSIMATGVPPGPFRAVDFKRVLAERSLSFLAALARAGPYGPDWALPAVTNAVRNLLYPTLGLRRGSHDTICNISNCLAVSMLYAFS